MKIRASLLPTLALCLGLTTPSLANISVENDYFVINFANTDGWLNYSSPEMLAKMEQSVQNSIDYLGGLLGENHKPLTGAYPTVPGQNVTPWERRVTVDIDFGVNALASAAFQTYDYTNLPDFHLEPLTVANGNSYTHMTIAEMKLKSGYNLPISLMADTQNPDGSAIADATITFGTGVEFTFEKSGVLGYDFESIFLHEMGHILGFESQAYGNSGYVANNGTTALDASLGTYLGAASGEATYVTTQDENGNIVNVATVRNPSGGTFDGGQDIIHLNDENSLMYYTTQPGTIKRELTEVDLAVMEAMGWDLTTSATPPPEPPSIVPTELKEMKFETEGGLGVHDVYTLTGLSVADGMINGSLTLNINMTEEQLKYFLFAYDEGEIIGFELAGISSLEGIFYNDITLFINGVSYEVLGATSVLAGGSSSNYNVVLYIPEPSSATLSLLALAGLMARRRRKK